MYFRFGRILVGRVPHILSKLPPIFDLARFNSTVQSPTIVRLSQVGTHRMSTMSKPSVYITRSGLPMSGVRRLEQQSYELIQRQGENPVPREELLRDVKGANAIFCLLTDMIDEVVLDAAGPNLKVIGTMSVGHDHIDIDACKRRGIPVGYTPDVLTDATAELTVALLLATSRRLMEGVNAVKSGEWGTWQPLWLCGQGLQNSTVGIVGLGRIGMGVAERLKPHKVAKFLYSGRSPKSQASDIGADFVPFEELLEKSDFVIACCALNPQTKDMFNKSALKKMKKTAILVNSSRGGIINQEDLLEALSSGEIGGAGLDVTTPEPLPPDHPLLKLDNCVILPHIGSATTATREAMSDLTALNIIAALEGREMPHQIP